MKKNLKLKVKRKWLWIKFVLIKDNHSRIGPLQKIRAIRYGFPSDFWKTYDLKHNNPKDYIPEYMRQYSREIDGDYKVLMDNKVIFTEWFGRYVKVPKIRFLILDSIYDTQHKRITSDEFLDGFKEQKYIIKPIEGSGGHGVHLIEESDGLFIDGRQADRGNLEELIGKCRGSIVNDYVVQHEYSSRIWPKSVNTIRIITIRDPETNEILLPYAAHRFGNSLSGAADNLSSGGYMTKIDIQNGQLGPAQKWHDTTLVKIHPDTGVAICGTVIPGWSKICRDLIAVHGKMPYIPFIAWDVAVTPDDFVILETNASCGVDLMQRFGSLRGTKLWDFYRYYGIVR